MLFPAVFERWCCCSCRLYLSTNVSNPHYLPSVCIQVTVINFTVTFDGLQEQLLSSVVRQVLKRQSTLNAT